MSEIVTDALSSAAYLLIAVGEALLSSKLGHRFLNALLTVAEPLLSLGYHVQRVLIGPLIQMLPRPTRILLRSILLTLFRLLPIAFLQGPLREVSSVVIIQAVGVKYGKEAQDDMELFLRLGTGGRFLTMAGVFGSGMADDLRNRYFPAALSQGPQVGNAFYEAKQPQVTSRHVQIAETLLFLAILAYRPASVLRQCLAHGALPNVRYYSVDTDETRLFIFLGDDWAVFCFGGSEWSMLADFWATCVAEETVSFSGHARCRRRLYQAMRACLGDTPSRRYTLQPPIAVPGCLDATALDLVQHLARKSYKIYTTGHAQAGALAILMGAYLQEHASITPTAVVSFGAPPVAGNQPFVDWYRRCIPASWRFVHGNEFGPQAPPLPFVSKVRLLHVDHLIDTSTWTCLPRPRSYEETMRHLSRPGDVASLLHDANPVLTLRHLKLAHVQAEQALIVARRTTAGCVAMKPS